MMLIGCCSLCKALAGLVANFKELWSVLLASDISIHAAGTAVVSSASRRGVRRVAALLGVKPVTTSLGDF
jgi:hypothetical protein